MQWVEPIRESLPQNTVNNEFYWIRQQQKPTDLFFSLSTNLHKCERERRRYCSGIFYQFIIHSITVRFAQSKLSKQYLNQRRNHCVRSICSIILYYSWIDEEEKERNEECIDCVCVHFVDFVRIAQRFDSDKCRLVFKRFKFSVALVRPPLLLLALTFCFTYFTNL